MTALVAPEGARQLPEVVARSSTPALRTKFAEVPESAAGAGLRVPASALTEPPFDSAAPPSAPEVRTPRGLAVARSQLWRELPRELRVTPRSVAALGHPVFAESLTPPMAPQRAPEFVTAQPGTRTPWNGPAEQPAPGAEAPPPPVHDLSVVIPPQADRLTPREGVTVRVLERGGQVKIAVHTANADLAQSLREQLGELVQSLERSGYRAETWRPGEPPLEAVRAQDTAGEAESAGPRGGDPQSSGDDPSRQQRHRRQDQPLWSQRPATSAPGRGQSTPPQEELT